MATQRRSTRTTPLVQMIKEVYDTKLRMKEVLETQSDDFEEYGTLTHNKFVDYYNKGYVDGFNDGYHVIFPDVQLDEDDWKDGLRDKVSFTPTVPEYSTGSDIDNLIVMMQDSLRCRLLIKDELYPGWETDGIIYPNEDEFVTYPDYYIDRCASDEHDGYEAGFEDGYNKAVDDQYAPPTIIQDVDTITIINNADFGEIWYWFDDDTFNRQLYTGPFVITQDCTIHAFMMYDGHVSRITSLECVCYTNSYFTVSLLDTYSPYFNNITVHPRTNIKYSTDKYNWTELTWSGSSNQGVQIYFTSSKKIYFKCSTSASIVTSEWQPIYFRISNCRVEVSGNLGSLYFGDAYTEADVANSSFYASNLFNTDDLGIYPSEFKLVYAHNLVLPNVNLINGYNSAGAGYNMYTYAKLFRNCSSLTTVPKLPANNAEYGYIYMFYNCESLRTFCGLLNVADGAGHRTVEKPRSLHSTLGFACYDSMFRGCTSLTTAPELPATTLAQGGCYYAMFYGCTSLTTAPELPATTLEVACYSNMFNGCTSLNYIKCLATDISASDCTTNWVYGVASSGTFVKDASMTGWTTGNNGIASGWTVVDAA